MLVCAERRRVVVYSHRAAYRLDPECPTNPTTASIAAKQILACQSDSSTVIIGKRTFDLVGSFFERLELHTVSDIDERIGFQLLPQVCFEETL